MNKKVMLKTMLSMCLLSSTLYFTGCNDTPKCSASKTKDTIIQIAKNQLKEDGVGNLIPKFNFEVVNIRTLEHNKDVDSYKCAADFKLIGDRTKTLPITYTVEKTDDGDNFYVNVYGLK